MPKVTRYLLYGLLTFIVGILICALIRPNFLEAERSISAFGTTKATIIPYALALLGTSFWLMKARGALPLNNAITSKLASVLLIMSVTLVAILLTPFSVNRLFLYAHDIISLILFGAELYASILIITHVRKDILSYILFAIQVSGSVLLILSLEIVNVLNLHLVSELMILTSFIVLLMRSAPKLES